MGNQQTRKRPAERISEDKYTKRRKIESEYDCLDFPTTSEQKKFPLEKRHSSFLRLSSLLHLTPSKTQKADRCKSIDNADITKHLKGENHCTRPEFPMPWTEALFLPEFPVRSMITEKSFTISNELGSGSFGTVYRAVAKHDPRGIYAIKVQEKSKVLGRNAALQVRREAALLRMMRPHIFVSRLYATWQSRSKLYSVLQYPVGGLGDLYSVWRDYGNFSEATLRVYAAELASAIDFIHRSDIIYRDLKMENVILDAEGHIQIIDFGLAKRLKNGDETTTICGTLQYMSPDVSSGIPYSHYIDWWSFAVILHILYTGKYPYPNADATHHKQLKFLDYSTPIGCSKEVGNLLDRLLLVNKERRLCSFEVLHAHPFFTLISFEDAEARMYNPLERIKGLGYFPSTNEVNSRDVDDDESCTVFDEHYEFSDFEFFNDRM